MPEQLPWLSAQLGEPRGSRLYSQRGGQRQSSELTAPDDCSAAQARPKEITTHPTARGEHRAYGGRGGGLAVISSSGAAIPTNSPQVSSATTRRFAAAPGNSLLGTSVLNQCPEAAAAEKTKWTHLLRGAGGNSAPSHCPQQ